MALKQCRQCGEWKDREEFYRISSSKNGRRSQCKKCFNNNQKMYDKLGEVHKKEYNKRRYISSKQKDIKAIEKILNNINPIFEEFKLPIYGYIYRFYNIKTKRSYIGQTTRSFSTRYPNNPIKSWIRERKLRDNQKFIDELNERDIEVIQIVDVGCCQYHLDI